MKKLFLACLILMAGILLFAQTEEWLWVAQGNGVLSGIGCGITTDSAGNLYVVGAFQGTTTFGTISLTCSGGSDIFVAKLDSEGNWLWAVRAGGTGDDNCWGISRDSAGNIFVSGQFTNTASFGTISITSAGSEDFYVAKLDANGNWLWVTHAGGTGLDRTFIAALDSYGNICIVGLFVNTVTFGTTSLTSAGGYDIYVAKLDSEGNWLWAKRAGGITNDEGYGLALDNAANVYISGYFTSTADFGALSLSSNGSGDMFVAKLDSNSNWLWVTSAGGTGQDFVGNMAVDSAANVYISGTFRNTVTFGLTSLISYGGEDICAAKLDTNGNWLWATSAGGTGSDLGYCIAVDDNANTYVGGYFNSSPAAFGDWALTTGGNYDIYAAKLNPGGHWEYAYQAGGTGIDYCFNITADNAGNVYLTGNFRNTATFGTITLTSGGEGDIFVAKLGTAVGNDDETEPEVPVISYLFDASPNPFRSCETTQIKTYISDRESGTLSIYNLRGQLIQTYELSSGTHEISFDGKGLASGVYLYRLKTQSVNAVKKLVLLK